MGDLGTGYYRTWRWRTGASFGNALNAYGIQADTARIVVAISAAKS